ncbi:helix-turn-helix domain-containing protein [Dactylosporangium sp. CS-047395]|uniref:helix-turn-helix domain-containing protein n=1 Tax=Dactylosporangium sp. CS-047395 TaxID=3239936 RepID=UPI003D8C7C05
MTIMLDLEEFPITDDLDFLRDQMLRAPVPLELDPHPGSHVIVRSRVADLGSVHLLSTRAGGGDVVRTERLSRDSTPPGLTVSVVDHGVATVIRDETVVQLHPGDVALYATAEPYRLAFTPGARRFSYQFPLDTLELPWDVIHRQLHRAIRPDGTTAAAVSAFLRSTGRTAPQASDREQRSLEHSTLALIRLLLTRVVADTAPGRAASATSLAIRIEEHVKARLEDTSLSARSIADAFSISERYVYLILAGRGIDLGDMIRQRRLDKAARMLEAPSTEHVTISHVAHHCGFADHSHFSRSFRARFGMSPTRWRALHRKRVYDLPE